MYRAEWSEANHRGGGAAVAHHTSYAAVVHEVMRLVGGHGMVVLVEDGAPQQEVCSASTVSQVNWQ